MSAKTKSQICFNGNLKKWPSPAKSHYTITLKLSVMHQSIPAAPIPPRANPRALALFLFWVANSRGWG